MRLAFVLLTAAALAGAEPRLAFTRSFPGSTPAFFSITVEKSGVCVYKEAPDDQNPLQFQLNEDEIREMFALADKLDRFGRPLESPLKVAFMGMKTFRYDDGAKSTEVKFNFSEDLDARSLADWFEKIGETAMLFIQLERSVKYDKLGVNKAILQFESALDKKRIVSPSTFLPMLDRVVKNDSYINMARIRAANIAQAIRAPK